MISFDDLKNLLIDSKSKSIYRSQLMFRSNKHEIYTVEANKIAPHRDNDKWIVKKNGISTLARGHNSLGWNSLLGFISLLVTVSLQDYLVISRILRFHYQTSMLTLF